MVELREADLFSQQLLRSSDQKDKGAYLVYIPYCIYKERCLKREQGNERGDSIERNHNHNPHNHAEIHCEQQLNRKFLFGERTAVIQASCNS